jgi:hypothetical protein
VTRSSVHGLVAGRATAQQVVAISRPQATRAVFIPFLVYDLEIRREICSTNAIESLNTGVPSAPVGISRANRPR